MLTFSNKLKWIIPLIGLMMFGCTAGNAMNCAHKTNIDLEKLININAHALDVVKILEVKKINYTIFDNEKVIQSEVFMKHTALNFSSVSIYTSSLINANKLISETELLIFNFNSSLKVIGKSCKKAFTGP